MRFDRAIGSKPMAMCVLKPTEGANFCPIERHEMIIKGNCSAFSTAFRAYLARGVEPASGDDMQLCSRGHHYSINARLRLNRWT